MGLDEKIAWAGQFAHDVKARQDQANLVAATLLRHLPDHKNERSPFWRAPNNVGGIGLFSLESDLGYVHARYQPLFMEDDEVRGMFTFGLVRVGIFDQREWLPAYELGFTSNWQAYGCSVDDDRDLRIDEIAIDGVNVDADMIRKVYGMVLVALATVLSRQRPE